MIVLTFGYEHGMICHLIWDKQMAALRVRMTTVRRNGKTYHYHQLVRAVRRDGRPTHEIVAHLGNRAATAEARAMRRREHDGPMDRSGGSAPSPPPTSVPKRDRSRGGVTSPPGDRSRDTARLARGVRPAARWETRARNFLPGRVHGRVVGAHSYRQIGDINEELRHAKVTRTEPNRRFSRPCAWKPSPIRRSYPR